MKPYYEDEYVALYHGNARAFLTSEEFLARHRADVAIVDPPYGETSLAWDRWVDDWPRLLLGATSTFWCFGSLRMFHEHGAEFGDWKLAQEVVWEKHNGSSFHADRFKRVHELAVQFYRGEWSNLHRDVPTTPDATARAVRRKERPPHTGEIEGSTYVSVDGGPRLMRSVIYCRSEHGKAVHPTQKPLGIVEPLISYSCPPGGLVLDPFAGSGTSLVAARNLGRRAVGIEAKQAYCAVAVRRLMSAPLTFGEAS